MGGIVRTLGGVPEAVGGVSDQVHLMVAGDGLKVADFKRHFFGFLLVLVFEFPGAVAFAF